MGKEKKHKIVSAEAHEFAQKFTISAALGRDLPDITEDCDPNLAVGFGRQNGVEQLVLEKLAQLKPGYFSNLHKNRVEYGKNYEAETQEIVKLAKKSGLQLLIVKSPGVSRSFGEDVDVLNCGDEPLDNVKSCFEEAGYRFFPSLMTLKEPGKYFFLRKHDGFTTGLRPRIHLHMNMGWMGVEFFDKTGLWSRRKNTTSLPTTSIMDSMAILAAHSVYEVGWIKLGELLDVADYLSNGADLEEARENAFRQGWVNGFDTFILLARAFAERLEVPIKLPEFDEPRMGWLKEGDMGYSPRIPGKARFKSWVEKLGFLAFSQDRNPNVTGRVLLQLALQRVKCPW